MSTTGLQKRARVRAAVEGGMPDRPPVSAWGHFFDRETSATALADALVGFHNHYGWDYFKVHARASYHVEGWGFAYEPARSPTESHVCTSQPIAEARDWLALQPLPLETPAFQEQLALLRLIRDRIGPETPLIMTVFSPLDVAEKLLDRRADLLLAYINQHPRELEAALEVMAVTFARFVQALVAEGVDGIFFSTKWANHNKLAADQYQRLVRPFDLYVLEAAKPMWCNMLHLCENQVQLDAMADYPVQVFHWDRSAGDNPALAAGRDRLGRAVGGGVDAKTLAQGAPGAVEAMALDALQSTGRRGFLLGPGCSVQMARTPPDNLRALRRAVEA